MSGKSLFENAIAFSPILAKVFGACGALLIQQIHYHCAGKTNFYQGEYWVYNTTKAWAERFMIWDERTIRSSLSRLRTLGVVVVCCNNSHGYDKTLWYRINYEVLCLKLSESLPMWKFFPNGCGNFFRIHAEIFSAPIPKKEAEITSKTTLQNPTPSSGEKEEEMLPKNKGAKVPTNVASVLAQNLSGGSAKVSRSMGMYKVWASSLPKFHPEVKFVGPFTVAQKSMVSRVATSWGPAAEKVLAYLVEHWVSFGKSLKDLAGLKSYPEIPVLEFLVKHSAMGMNFYLNRSVQLSAKTSKGKSVGDVVVSGKITIKKSQPPTPSPVQPVKPSAPPVAEKYVTLEEILAYDPSKDES